MITRTLTDRCFAGHTESHPITGLVRNDYYDWPAQARAHRRRAPTPCIMLIGGNDNQPIHLPSDARPAGHPGVGRRVRRAPASSWML